MRATLLVLALVACNDEQSAGGRCGTDDDCGDNLFCLSKDMASGTHCIRDTLICTIPCTFDTDCAPLGSGFTCAASCPGSPRICR